MPEIISYHDNEQNVQRTLDTVNKIGIKQVANILTVMVVLLALPVTLFAIRQVSVIRQQASGSNLTINAAALNGGKDSYQITLLGDNLSPLMKAKLYDGDTLWADNIEVVYENATKLTISIPQGTPPSRCNLGQNCTLKVQLIDPSTNFLSNKITIPAY